MRYLLDTNTCIAVMRHTPSVILRMSAVPVGDCAISTITAYELFTGIEKCADPPRERSKVNTLLSTVTEVSFDDRASREAARIRAILESNGQMIGAYDVLIAGHALSEQLVVVTHNTAEFSRVPGLPLEDWQTALSTP